MPLTTFRPPHKYKLDENGVSDPETLQLVRDTISVNISVSSQFVGARPLRSPRRAGPRPCPYPGLSRRYASWIERRVEALIRSWLPDWELSHAQVVDLDKQELQSRSWDLVVHQPVPKAHGERPSPTTR